MDNSFVLRMYLWVSGAWAISVLSECMSNKCIEWVHDTFFSYFYWVLCLSWWSPICTINSTTSLKRCQSWVMMVNMTWNRCCSCYEKLDHGRLGIVLHSYSLAKDLGQAVTSCFSCLLTRSRVWHVVEGFPLSRPKTDGDCSCTCSVGVYLTRELHSVRDTGSQWLDTLFHI